MRDLVNNIGAIAAIPPEVVSGTRTSETIDTAGFESLALAIQSGDDVGSADFSIEVQHSDTGEAIDFDPVPEGDLVYAGVFPGIVANDLQKVGYIGNKRYVRAVLTLNSGTSMALSVLAMQGHAHSRPVA